MSATILIVDDEARIRRLLEMALQTQGYRVLTAGSVSDAEELIATQAVDLVITDLALPERSGIEFLAELRQQGNQVPVILITAFGSVESAVEAMKLGAFDYVLKPFRTREVEALVARALKLTKTEKENVYHREVASKTFEGITAQSAAMEAVIESVRRVATTSSSALVTGETGVGKELVARAIHRHSERSEELFVPLNCAAIPPDLLEAELFGVTRGAYTGATKDRPGKFEVADAGTLFLDEVGDMPLAMQAKLLRVLQEGVIERLGSNVMRTVDVRIIAATHRDLERMVEEGTFRADLYYRINVLPIHIPPLRDRVEDILPIANVLIASHARRLGRSVTLAEDAVALLEAYGWPGNVRELNSILERAVLLTNSEALGYLDFPSLHVGNATSDGATASAFPLDGTMKSVVQQAELAAIGRALERTGDNKTRAAALLGISVRSLWYKLKAGDDSLGD